MLAKRPERPDGCAFLCVGIVAPHKGQDMLIEALAALSTDETWTCTIAGSLDTCPDYADRVAARADAAGIGDRVTMTGVLNRDELDRAYQRADLLVAPSRTESYGMAIADALRRGIPVMVSRTGGIPQTVASRGQPSWSHRISRALSPMHCGSGWGTPICARA